MLSATRYCRAHVPSLLLFSILLSCLARPGWGAEKNRAERLKPGSYSFAHAPGVGARFTDPAGVKLMDGITDDASGRVIWRTRGFNFGPLDLTFAFVAPVDLDAVRVHCWRGPRGYGIKRIQVFAGNGRDFMPVGEIIPDQGYNLEKDAQAFQAFMIKAAAKNITTVRVRILGHSFIALTEIEFFGARQQPRQPRTTKCAGNQAGSGKAEAYSIPEGSGFRLLEADLNHDGHKDILLENEQARYIVEPRWGGVVNYALNKHTGTNPVRPFSNSTRGGLFGDMMWPRSKATWSCYGAAYRYEIVARGPDRLAVRLVGRGQGGLMGGVIFDKTFTLRKGDIALRADYKLRNHQENVIPITSYGWWFHNSFISPKEEFQLFWPAPTGIQTAPGGEKGDFWSYEPTRGWLGMVTASGSGYAFVHDYRFLRCHYFWRNGRNFSTVEWRFSRIPIPAGGHIETTVWLVPFSGVGVPDGVSRVMAGSIAARAVYGKADAPTTLKLRICPNHQGDFVFLCEQRKLPQGRWVRLNEIRSTLAAKPAELETPFKPEGSGTYVVRVVAKEFGRPIMTMERPVTVGRSTASYAMTPPMKRIRGKAEKKQVFDLDFHAMDVATPHVKWAQPFAGGSPRVLFLPQAHAGIREAIEVAQRFAMQPHTSYISRNLRGCLYDLGDYYGKLNPSNQMPHVEKMLKSGKFDVFVIPGNLWQHMTPWIRDEIVRRVEDEGCGLVLLAPEKLPKKLAPLMRLLKPDKRFCGAWKPADAHYLTVGIPFDALPPTQALPYETSGRVVATIAGKPLVVAARLGKGRVAAAGWVVGGRNRTGYYNTYGGVGLLPNLLWTGVNGVEHHYWEYQMSLLARMIYWAGQKVPAISAESLIVKQEGHGKCALLILMNHASAPLQAEIRLTIRDRYFRVETTSTVSHLVPPGTTKVSLPFALPALEGLHFADVIVRMQGKTAWWGSSAFTTTASARISGIKPARSLWRGSEKVRGTIQVQGALAPESGARIQLELVDGFGRIFERSTLDVQGRRLQGQQGRLSLPFALALTNCRGLRFNLRARLLVNNKAVSEARAWANLYSAPRADRLQVAFGWPWYSVGGVRRFLMKGNYQRLKAIGATCIRIFRVSRYEWEQARELGLGTLKSSGGKTAGGKNPTSSNAKKGKYGLIRKPCLSDPVFLRQLEESNAEYKPFEAEGVLYRGKGDEVNSIRTWDGCFSEHCQKEFRAWLKRRYTDLDTLNRVWETRFASWDKVEAMTHTEVKGRHSLAPWADHRTFNEWNWARAFGLIRRGMARGAPGVRLGISGTQETNAFNAYDWWRLAQNLNALASYGGEQTVMQRCFAKNLVWMPWIGYGRSRAYLRQQVWRYLFQGATGFNVFSGRLSVNPDWTLPEVSRDLQAVLREIGRGRAEAIMQSEYEASPVAFHYSPSSIHVDWILGLDDARRDAVAGMRDALMQFGCDYDYLAYAQLETGGLRRKEYRLLVLPMSSALSVREADAIRAFVKQGGVLVADMLAGALSENGRWRAAPVLDDVFGIRRVNPSITRIISEDAMLEGSGDGGGINCGDLKIMVKRFETGFACTSGRARAFIRHRGTTHPAVVVNHYGRGYAVYFACDLMGVFGTWKEMKYLPQRSAATRAVTGLFGAILRSARVPERLVPRMENGGRLVAVECFMRRNGPARIVGMIRGSGAIDMDPRPHKVMAGLPAMYHVYDMLESKYLGFTDTAKCIMAPRTVKVLTLLPYRVEALNITASAKVYAPGETVSLTIIIQARTGAFARHALAVRVISPDGRRREAYSGIAFAGAGICRHDFPLAYNDLQGTWRVEVVDALTGVNGSGEFRVER